MLLINMSLPKTCAECPIEYDCCGCPVIGVRWFKDTEITFDPVNSRHPDCPIICELDNVRMTN